MGAWEHGAPSSRRADLPNIWMRGLEREVDSDSLPAASTRCTSDSGWSELD